MPYLPGVTFTKNGADGKEPTVVNDYGNIWEIKVPASAESIAADATTNVDSHVQITLPTGYQAYLVDPPGGVAGCTTAGVEGCIIRDSGAQAIVVPISNVGLGANTATENGALCHVVIEPIPMYSALTSSAE